VNKPTVLLPIAALLLAAFQAAAQDASLPRVLFCAGQCYGVAENGERVPVTKGTELAPGLKLETGPGSYLQVKLGPDNAAGIGENARVRFEPRTGGRDVVVLDQGRIRMIGGDLVGRPGARPVELRTTEGTLVLRNADIEVKSLPKVDARPGPTLVKLNVGDARIGDLPVSRDVVQGLEGGKILDRAISIGDIALRAPVVEPATTGRDAPTEAKTPLLSIPVATLPVFESRPIVTDPVNLSPAIEVPTLPGFTRPTGTTAVSSTTTTLSTRPATTLSTTALIKPVLASDLILAQPLDTGGSRTSLTTIAKDIQAAPTTTTSTSTLLNQQNLTLQKSTTTTTTTLTPKTFTLTR
jgi:hypothetical protein